MGFDYIRRQRAAASWINESQCSLVNRAHCEHSESMTYLCRLVWFLYNNKWAVEAKGSLHGSKKIQRERRTLGSAVIVCICPFSVRASGGGSGLP